MLPRLCVAVAGPAIICGVFDPTNASGQAGTLTAAVSGIVAAPVGQPIDTRNVGPGASVGVRYVPTSLTGVAIRLDLAGLPASVHTVFFGTTNGSSELFATAGPEFSLPVWNGHIYTLATAGVARIWTSSTTPFPELPAGVSPSTGPRPIAGGTDFAWSGGAGFVTARSSFGIAGDFGLRYYDLGSSAYVANGYDVEHLRTTFLAPSIGLNWRP
jgi:hypothetical protein